MDFTPNIYKFLFYDINHLILSKVSGLKLHNLRDFTPNILQINTPFFSSLYEEQFICLVIIIKNLNL